MFLRVHFLAHTYAAKGPTSAASNAANSNTVFNATGIRALLQAASNRGRQSAPAPLNRSSARRSPGTVLALAGPGPRVSDP